MKTKISSPEAYIAVGKNRQKIYGENTVYLSDKQEFEFEFFNPTQDNVMAKISINGKPISNRGLILRPGMRGWIERYIDEDRRFLFETYVVDGSSKAVQKAIENNGDIKIEFFKEKQKPKPNYNISYGSYSTGTIRGSCSTYTALNDTLCIDGDALCFNSSVDYSPEEESSRGIVSASSGELNRKRSLSKKIETGRVEKGSVSGQHFTEVDMEFEYFPFYTIDYKLMPLSQKPAEFNELKLKCSKCGTKVKSNWKFCPVCGKTVNDEAFCTHCGTKVDASWNYCPNCNTKLK